MATHPAALTTGSPSGAPTSELATNPILSGVLAGLVLWVCAFFGEEAPWPSILWVSVVAVFLSLGVYTDMRWRRLPNLLTFGALVGGLAFHALAPASFGALGIGPALFGCAVGAAMLFPYALGLLGAGDVKASMALGALVGAPVLAGTFYWSALLGGVVGLAILAARSGFGEMFMRWKLSGLTTLGTGRATYLAPEPHEAAAQGLPYGVTLGFGFVLNLALGVPWS